MSATCGLSWRNNLYTIAPSIYFPNTLVWFRRQYTVATRLTYTPTYANVQVFAVWSINKPKVTNSSAIYQSAKSGPLHVEGDWQGCRHGDRRTGAGSIVYTHSMNGWRHIVGAGLTGPAVVDCGLFSPINHLSNQIVGVMRKVHNGRDYACVGTTIEGHLRPAPLPKWKKIQLEFSK